MGLGMVSVKGFTPVCIVILIILFQENVFLYLICYCLPCCRLDNSGLELLERFLEVRSSTL
jgi:hypothetical protein